MSDIADALRGCAEIDVRPHNALLEEAADEISRLRQELALSRQTLEEERVRAREAIRDMRVNPLATLYGDFYFADATGTLYVASIGNKQIRLMKRAGRCDYLLLQIPSEEYAKRVKDQV